MKRFVLSALLFLGTGHEAVAQADGPSHMQALNNLTSPYTLTAYAPCNPVYNGLKVNNLNLFQAKVSQYCPSKVVTVCPNGTDMVFAGSLYPVGLL
jgi:hypothetical protein